MRLIRHGKLPKTVSPKNETDMNYLQLAKSVIGFYFFMKRQTSNYGEPVDLNEEECEKVIESLKSNSFSKYKFYFVLDIRSMKHTYMLNVEKFLTLKNNNFSVDATFRAIHPDYLVENLQWAETTFRYVTTELKFSEGFKPLQQYYRIQVPMKLLDNNYHWLMMECSPLQLDKNNNVITVLISYTVLRPFVKGEKTLVMGTLYDENFENKPGLNYAFWKTYFVRKPLVLTLEQNKIIDLLIEDISRTNADIADLLQKKKNTIDIQNKQILERARLSFQNETFDNVRDVVEFMKSMNL